MGISSLAPGCGEGSETRNRKNTSELNAPNEVEDGSSEKRRYYWYGAG